MSQLDARVEAREAIRKSLITGGGFPQNKVDEIFSTRAEKKIELPDSLTMAFLNLQKSAIKCRIAIDDDF